MHLKVVNKQKPETMNLMAKVSSVNINYIRFVPAMSYRRAKSCGGSHE